MAWRTWVARLTDSSGVVLTPAGVRSAYAVAIATDVLQVALGPFGWAFADEILDVVAMLATSWILGFHPLLLPTFVIELVPIVDVLPTWTGCVALVVAMRRKRPPPPDDDAVTIDVKPTSVT